MDNVVVFSTESSSYFAHLIAEQLEIRNCGAIERKIFGDGERYYRLGIGDRKILTGYDVVFVASTHMDADLLELYRVGCALAEHGARRRIFVIPFFGYSTMDREVEPGDVVTAKTNARLLSSIPNTGMGNVFLFLDLHSSGIVHYFEGDCLRAELYAETEIISGIEDLLLGHAVLSWKVMFASADLGRTKWVQSYAEHFGTDMAFIHKRRTLDDTAVKEVIGDVNGKVVIIYDDMIRSGSTLVKAAKAYREAGAKEVFAVASHLALNNECIAQYVTSCVAQIVSTNSHPMSQSPVVRNSDRFRVLDVSGVFAKAISNIL